MLRLVAKGYVDVNAGCQRSYVDVNITILAVCGDIGFHESCDLRYLLSTAIQTTTPQILYVSLPHRGVSFETRDDPWFVTTNSAYQNTH